MTKSTPTDAVCKFPPGFMVPVINPGRCEAHGPCVAACPYDVLAIQIVAKDERRKWSLADRLKLFFHGGKQAYAVNADACRGCGLCVQVCPEEAITLRRLRSADS